MIKTNKKITKKILLIAIIIVAITNNKIVYAEAPIEYGRVTRSSGSSSGPIESKPHTPGDGKVPKVDNINSGKSSYFCEYERSINPNTRIVMNSYDINGNPLMNGNILVNQTFASGTWIGLRTQETKTVNWKVYQNTYKYYKRKKKYTCIYEWSYTQQSCDTCSKWQEDDIICNKNYKREKEKCVCRNNTGLTKTSIKKIYDVNKTCTHSSLKDYPCNCTNTKNSKIHEEKIEKEYNEEPQCSDYKIIDGNKYIFKEIRDDGDIIKEDSNVPKAIKDTCTKKSITNTKNDAIKYVVSPTSELRILDFYDNAGKKDDYTNENANIEGKLKTVTYETEGIEEEPISANEGKYIKVFNFKPKKVCMDRIKSVVRYIYNGDSECNQNEIDVTTGKSSKKENGKILEFWRYFIPLNAINGKQFYIKYEKTGNSKKLDKEECYSIIDNYPLEKSYKYLILKKDGNSFTGSSKIDKEIVNQNEGCKYKKNNKLIDIKECIKIINKYPSVSDYTNYIRTKNNEAFKGKKDDDEDTIDKNDGCIFSTKVSFDIEQKFYGQTSNYQSLKGYNLYFRQIDINNPFPNGIDNDSIWKGLYNSKKVNTGKEEIKLSSFDNITYIANISSKNANKIRTFNKETSYTQWTKDYGKNNGMNVNGQSYFVRYGSTKSIFTTKAPTDSFYKLGCGPTNKDWSWCKS